MANHISHADPLVSAHFIYDSGRWPQYLGKASVFRVPVVGWILHRCRQIPVERGSVDAVRSLDALVAALDEGGAVVIYPEGTTTRQPDLWPMKAKTGAARLALATGAPVVPVVMWGPERIFDPRTGPRQPAPPDPGDRGRRGADRPEPVGGRPADPGHPRGDDGHHHVAAAGHARRDPWRHPAATVGTTGPVLRRAASSGVKLA